MKRIYLRLLPLAVALVAAPSLFATDPGIPSPNSVIVEAGETGHNDDVTVVNSSQQIESDAKARITPKNGGADKDSTVNTQGGFMGTVSGIEEGDTVNVGANSGDESQPNLQVQVIGSGGTVNLGNDSLVQVTNTSTPQQDPANNTNIVVTVPTGGPPTVVGPGQSVVFDTF